MANALHSSDGLNFFGVKEQLSSTGTSSVIGVEEKQCQDGEVPHQDEPQQQQQQKPLLGYGVRNDPQSDDFLFKSTDHQTSDQEEISKFGKLHFGRQDNEPKKEKKNSACRASLDLIKDFGNRVKRFKSERVIEPTSVRVPPMNVVDGELSTEEIIRIAATRYISYCSGKFDAWDPSLGGGLSEEDAEKVELSESLLVAAERVGNEQFESASRLIRLCQELSSTTGNPVQKVGYYFSEALTARIDAKTGKTKWEGVEKEQSLDVDDILMKPNPIFLACQEHMPFCQVQYFSAVQIIVENTMEAKRIHIIDIAIRSGDQWTIFMQALATRTEYPIEQLKITAIGGTKPNQSIEDTGKKLTRFANSLKLPFSFKMVMESELLGLKRELLELHEEEIVAIYSAYLPRSLIAVPDRLDSIMKTFSDINPCIMVVSEVESNQSSPSFMHRFVETLFFYSSYFDCLDTCMERDDPNRKILESMYFAEGIKNVIATEGEERMVRNVNLDAWRKFFARYAMVETELSSSTLFAAKLILKRSSNGSFCSLDPDGKSLLIGWKGTPLHSLSAWKFVCQE